MTDEELSSRKSVAIIGTRGYPSYYGGFETAIRKIAPYLASRGWRVTVFGRKNAIRHDDPEIDRRVVSKITVGVESKSLSTLSYGLSATLVAVFRRPDVALVMNVANGYWIPVLRLRGIPVVVNVDGIEWDREKWGKLARLVFKGGAALTAKFATHIIGDAQAIVDRWKVDYGVNGIFIPYGGKAVSSLPLEDGLRHRDYVLVVARFVPENTMPEFIEAARELSKTRQIVIVGSSGYGGELEDAVRSLGATNSQVTWLGHISDDARLLSLWQHAGAYFHGHSVGGTNPALVQAMACGAPVVARDTVYNREVLGDSGLFTSSRPREIVSTINRLLDDAELQESLSRGAFDRASEVYTWDRVCADYAELLRRSMS